MRKTKLAVISIVFAVILPLFASPVLAQQAAYSIPANVPLKPFVRRAFPAYFTKRDRYLTVIAEQFYPIGWSRDGKFAYYVEPVDEACGCYFAELMIQDLRNDEVVWKHKFNQQDIMNAEGKESPEDNIQKLWASKRKLFTEKLREHGIEASRFVLLGKTFASGGKSYTAKLTTSRADDDDGYNRARTVTLELTSPKVGRKTLYTADYKSEMFVAPLDAAVIGAFKSPFENRAAILMLEVHRGYEGPPHTANVRLAGADLSKGFVSK